MIFINIVGQCKLYLIVLYINKLPYLFLTVCLEQTQTSGSMRNREKSQCCWTKYQHTWLDQLDSRITTVY